MPSRRIAAPLVLTAVLAAALPACQKSEVYPLDTAAESPDKALALDLEGRWLITSLLEEGEELVGREALYTYATLDFDYEGQAGGNLEISLASASARLHFDGAYEADADRGTVAFDGEASYAYGEASEIVEASAFEFSVGRESDTVLSLSGEVGGGPWVITARRD